MSLENKLTKEEFKNSLRELLLKMKDLTKEYNELKKQLKNSYH